GPAARLREVWERYHIPVAVTEAHLGCTRDEQLRWLSRVWEAALAVRAEGADIRAVTIWSMFGAVDWNSLLTRKTGFYEPGACDGRGLAAVILGRPGFDPADAEDARQKLETIRPWAVVNCCGFSGAIVAENEPDRCFRDNVVAATVLAEVCGRMGLPYAVLSSDQVFDGLKSAAYVESDP